jgi:ribosomal-protein-serine acetyltransferase
MKPILLDLPVPILTPRLILRPPQIGDGVVVNEAILESFEVLNEFMPWAKEKPSVEESEEFARQAAANWILKNNDEPYLPLFIFDKKTNQFIGGTGYHHYDWDIPSIETGYWIRNSYAGKGFMTEALNAITQYAFKQLGMKRLTITCDIDNVRSKKIPECLGFILEGTLKGNRRKQLTNEISDTLIYSRYDLNNLPNLAVTWENHNE